MEDETFITKNITNKDVYTALLKQSKDIKEIIAHLAELNHSSIKNANAIEANRQKLETKADAEKSIGTWIGDHPFQFTAFCLTFISFVISDIRQPLLLLVKNLFI